MPFILVDVSMLVSTSASDTRAIRAPLTVLSLALTWFPIAALPQVAQVPVFTNVTAEAGIEFVHDYLQPDFSETEWFAGGVAAGDYDNDGDIDLFVV